MKREDLKEVVEILMESRFYFDLDIRERLVLINHLITTRRHIASAAMLGAR